MDGKFFENNRSYITVHFVGHETTEIQLQSGIMRDIPYIIWLLTWYNEVIERLSMAFTINALIHTLALHSRTVHIEYCYMMSLWSCVSPEGNLFLSGRVAESERNPFIPDFPEKLEESWRLVDQLDKTIYQEILYFSLYHLHATGSLRMLDSWLFHPGKISFATWSQIKQDCEADQMLAGPYNDSGNIYQSIKLLSL